MTMALDQGSKYNNETGGALGHFAGAAGIGANGLVASYLAINVGLSSDNVYAMGLLALGSACALYACIYKRIPCVAGGLGIVAGTMAPTLYAVLSHL